MFLSSFWTQHICSSIYQQKKLHIHIYMAHQYHQIFTVKCQPHLLKPTFQPTTAQLQFGRQSLIQKSKIQNGYQQFLFCKKDNEKGEEFLSSNEKSLIQNYKKKYIDYIKVNYNEKIVEELYNLSKLRSKIRDFENKNKEEVSKKIEEDVYKKEFDLQEKKRKKESKVIGGKKKLKVQEIEEIQVKGNGKGKYKGKNVAKGTQKVGQEKLDKQVQVQDEIQSQSLQMELLNSLSMQDFEDDDEE